MSLRVEALMMPVLEATVPLRVTLSPTLMEAGVVAGGVVDDIPAELSREVISGKLTPPPILALVVSTVKLIPNTDMVRVLPLTLCTWP
jgi:hypothetical protein